MGDAFFIFKLTMMSSEKPNPTYIEKPWRTIGVGVVVPIALVYKAVDVFISGTARFKIYSSSSVVFELDGITAKIYAVTLIVGAVFLNLHYVWEHLFPESRVIQQLSKIAAWVCGSTFALFLAFFAFR